MFTIEIFKSDKRTKAQERLVEKIDTAFESEEAVLEAFQKQFPAPQYRLAVFETMVQVKNLMNNELVWERYDLPYYCSVRSETYWSA